MFNAISWGQYFTWTGAALLIYYAGLAVTCYRTEIRSLLPLGDKGSQYAEEDTPPEDISEMSARTIDEIHSIFQEAGLGASKQELLKNINAALVDFGGLRIPAYRSAMYDYIIREGKTICGVGIREEELEG